MSLKHFFQQSINKCGREDRKRTGPDFIGFSDKPTTQPEVSLGQSSLISSSPVVPPGRSRTRGERTLL